MAADSAIYGWIHHNKNLVRHFITGRYEIEAIDQDNFFDTFSFRVCVFGAACRHIYFKNTSELMQFLLRTETVGLDRAAICIPDSILLKELIASFENT